MRDLVDQSKKLDFILHVKGRYQSIEDRQKCTFTFFRGYNLYSFLCHNHYCPNPCISHTSTRTRVKLKTCSTCWWGNMMVLNIPICGCNWLDASGTTFFSFFLLFFWGPHGQHVEVTLKWLCICQASVFIKMGCLNLYFSLNICFVACSQEQYHLQAKSNFQLISCF